MRTFSRRRHCARRSLRIAYVNLSVVSVIVDNDNFAPRVNAKKPPTPLGRQRLNCYLSYDVGPYHRRHPWRPSYASRRPRTYLSIACRRLCYLSSPMLPMLPVVAYATCRRLCYPCYLSSPTACMPPSPPCSTPSTSPSTACAPRPSSSRGSPL